MTELARNASRPSSVPAQRRLLARELRSLARGLPILAPSLSSGCMAGSALSKILLTLPLLPFLPYTHMRHLCSLQSSFSDMPSSLHKGSCRTCIHRQFVCCSMAPSNDNSMIATRQRAPRCIPRWSSLATQRSLQRRSCHSSLAIPASLTPSDACRPAEHTFQLHTRCLCIGSYQMPFKVDEGSM